MSDDPHPCMKNIHYYLCRFVLKTLLLTATTAAFAQGQKVPQHNSDVRSDRLTLTLGAENISALTINQDKTVFYNDLPFIQNKKLDPWTHNKSIQKACESFRVSPEHKEYLKSLKV